MLTSPSDHQNTNKQNADVVAGRRYTVWLWWDGSRLVGDFARPPVGVELYAHLGDTEADFDLYVSVAD
jgi:hypothetical protein